MLHNIVHATMITYSHNDTKILTVKIVKLTDHANACKSLTNFEYEVNEMTENGNCWSPSSSQTCYCQG